MNTPFLPFMLEIDGPPQAYIEGKYGRIVFQTYALFSEDVIELMQAYANWRQYAENPGAILVWRQRPMITHDRHTDTGEMVYNLYYRCAFIPRDECVGTVPPKPEGAAVQRHK